MLCSILARVTRWLTGAFLALLFAPAALAQGQCISTLFHDGFGGLHSSGSSACEQDGIMLGYVGSNPAWTGINFGRWSAGFGGFRCFAVCSNPPGCGWPNGFPFSVSYEAACAEHNPDENRGEPCPSCGNPVHPGAGNKFQRELDYVGAGPFPLRYERAYNSLGASRYSDGLEAHGPGWWTTYRRAVVVDPELSNPYRVYVTRPNGTVIAFTASALTGPFVPAAPHHPDELTRLVDSGGSPTGWTFRSIEEDVTETFDASGDLLTITNRQGLTQTLAYHPVAVGQTVLPKLLASVTDPFGRQLVFAYDGLRRLQTMTAPGNQVYQFAYDPQAATQLLSVTYPDGRTRTYVSNEPANTSGATLPALTGIVDENGNRYATWRYDTQGRVIQSEHAGGVERTSVQYTGPTQSVVTDAFGVARTYQFANIGGALRNTSISGAACPSCGAAANTFDAAGYPASRTDWNGNKTCLTHDARGLETLRVAGLMAGASCPFSGALPAEARRVTTEWHAVYRLPLRIAEPLRITTFVYGDPGDPNPGNRGSVLSKTAQATSDATGEQGFSATAVGTPRTRVYAYNASGQAVTADGPRTDVADLTATTYYPNDDPDLGKRGNVATIANALGHVTQITAYNAHGQPLTIADPNGLTTILTYDARQRLTSRSVGGELTSYEYDGVGQLTRVTLPDGSFLAYAYDPAHRLTGISDSLGNRIAYTLDLMGNRTKEEVFDPANALAQTRSRVYSSLNRLSQELGAQNQTTSYAYDNQGNVTGITDPLNRVTANAYDALNRLKQMIDPASGVTRYGYDGLDQLASVTDPRNNATTYTVDGLGNLTQQVSPDTGATTNTQDAAGNVLSSTDAKGQTTTSIFDALNRITRIVYTQATGSQLKQIDYAYDQGPNGIGRLTAITETSGGGTVLQTTAYGYDQKGRVTSEARTIGGVVATTAYVWI